MDGHHSPWGTFGKVKAERGYTSEQLLWNEAWINLLMESVDALKYTKKRYVPTVDGAEGLREILAPQSPKRGV